MENMTSTLPTASTPSPAGASATTKDIQTWIVAYLSDLLELDPEEVETDVPFDSFGLDSSSAVGMTGDLEDWLGFEIDPTFIYDYPTIASLAQHLGEEREA